MTYQNNNDQLDKVIDSLISQRADLVQATIDNETDVFDDQIDKIDKLLVSLINPPPRQPVMRGSFEEKK